LTNIAMAFALSLAGGGVATACTSGSSAQKGAKGVKNGQDCVFFRTIDNWQVLDDSSLVLWTSGDRDAYLVTLFRPSPELPFAIDLALQDGNRDGQLCAFGGDAVITDGPTSERLTINTLTKLSEKQLKDVLAAHESTRGKRHEKPRMKSS